MTDSQQNGAGRSLLLRLTGFYRISEPAAQAASASAFKRVRWATFLSATLGYAIYYVCRLSMNIVRKPIVDDGVFTETELGIIGSCLFFVYAVGKMANGFLADRCNARRFLATGLLFTAIINLVLGMTNMFLVFAVLWGLNGWFQSMGAPACVVSLNRWYSSKERGTFYGFWSASHNLGEAITFITIALLVPGEHFWLDATAMVMFGVGIGVLICFLGGLMAVDIAPRAAAGAALGVVGIASYLGAGLQDVMNGVLIEGHKTVDVTGADVYDFTYVSWFWIGAAALSVLLTLMVWKARRNDV